MALADPDMLDRGRKAREYLSRLLAGQPIVSLIDLGYDADEPEMSRKLVLRVHVRRPITREALGLPADIDGFPIRILAGNYHLE
jgi:ABC-type uncharacterized transport system YnjBCD ATPase subunit